MGALEKMKAYKKDNAGEGEITLASDVVVTFPLFLSHAVVARANRRAKGNSERASLMVISDLCRFDGEKLSVTDISENLNSNDIGLIADAVFTDDTGDTTSSNDENDDFSSTKVATGQKPTESA